MVRQYLPQTNKSVTVSRNFFLRKLNTARDDMYKILRKEKRTILLVIKYYYIFIYCRWTPVVLPLFASLFQIQVAGVLLVSARREPKLRSAHGTLRSHHARTQTSEARHSGKARTPLIFLPDASLTDCVEHRPAGHPHPAPGSQGLV